MITVEQFNKQLGDQDQRLVAEFIAANQIEVKNLTFDTSYTNNVWWDAYQIDSRKHDVKAAWNYFISFATPIRGEYHKWSHKYYWWFQQWCIVQDIEQRLPILLGRLTKPLYMYASEYNYRLRRIEYKSERAEIVHIAMIRLENAKAEIETIATMPDHPPAPNPNVDAAWAYYLDILRLNTQTPPTVKRERKTYQPLVTTTTWDGLLKTLNNYPYMQNFTLDPKYFVAVNNVVVKTSMLVDWLQLNRGSLTTFTNMGDKLQLKSNNVAATFIGWPDISTPNELTLVEG